MIRGIEEVKKDILNYCKKKYDRINVISYFYNTSVLFLDIIYYYLNNNKSVLYITNAPYDNIEILKIIDKEKYVYIEDGIKENPNKINFCNYNNSLYTKTKYDLVIFDELSYIPAQSKKEMSRTMIENCKDNGTIIAYSIEPIFQRAKDIYFPSNKTRTPIIEPRIITTKINMNEDLPLVAYDYLMWSVQLKKRTIIYVPNEEKVINVYEYMNKLKDKITKNIFYFIKNKKDKSNIEKFLNSNDGILITDDYNEFQYKGLKNINIMVFFAEDKVFDYKSLVYIVSKEEIIKCYDKKEVIFLCKDENKHIDKARKIMRQLNKKGWEEGFLKW